MNTFYNMHIEKCAEIDSKAFASAKAILGIEDALNMWDVRNVLKVITMVVHLLSTQQKLRQVLEQFQCWNVLKRHFY